MLELRLGVSKGMLNVKYFPSPKNFFVQVEFCGNHKTVTEMRQNLTTLSFEGITGFKIVVSFCLCTGEITW